MSNDGSLTIQEIRKYFKEALFETVSTMAGMEIDEKDAGIEMNEISAAMILHGKKNALLSISTKKEYAAVLVAYMTGTEIDSVNDMERMDVISEIVNMTAGLVKVRISSTDYAFHLSSPFYFTGDHIEIGVKSHIEGFAIFAGSGELNLKLELYYL